MPEKPMAPSRLHSVRRNKSWRFVTLSGMSALGILWVMSEFIVFGFSLPIAGRKEMYLVSRPSAMSAGYHENGAGKPVVGVGLRTPAHSKKSELIPMVRFENPGVYILAPFWLFLIVFLLVQYLLLPKSLPVTEECERTD